MACQLLLLFLFIFTHAKREAAKDGCFPSRNTGSGEFIS
jgi:hypothetical protein